MGDGALDYAVWQNNLPESDPDRDWLLRGIKEGFTILNTSTSARACERVETENYTSATGRNKLLVEKQILEELANNRYVVVDNKPSIVSSLGAIQKTSGKIRLIHDCSRPRGSSLNDLCTKEPFRYTSLQDAIDLMTPGCYLGKIDLASAFRSVRIHPSNYQYTGLKWTFEGESEP